MRAYPDLASTGRLTLLTSLRCIPLALWDEETQRLVSFRKMWALERDRRTAAATRAAA
jgi:omega-6 fatty acid desaturase (delta-12 desaturase)